FNQNEINEFKLMQEFNNKIMHHQNDKGLEFLPDAKYYDAKDKLKKYQEFLTNLKSNIIK
ncbi:hypothetical protein IKS57_05295, partial [bacterium]|nr:hypothetical protein [bacterium]